MSSSGHDGETIATGAHGAHADVQLAATVSTAGAGMAMPESVGHYRLLQPLGEGGFGTVYLAEQQKPVVRRVALKIIKLGMDTKQVIARFEAERQALAMMDHPHIAKVLDGGATETGRPYFVMELVRGEPITDYCDKHQLTTRERLELFQQVCNAVQHAHQKGIIHRDIKPSNVLVTISDSKPVPKVIDFGIAKATSQRLTDKTVFTEMRQFIGTPVYMSPEQAGLTALDIDTRADIYSLGVLLYELLTGTTPFAADTLKTAGFAEMQRMIREVDPPKPSTRLSAMGGAITMIASRRKVDPTRLTRTIRGELDWIVMRALEKDRTRRYDTANGLGLEIARYLNDEPVLAGPPSATYRLSKLVKRHKGVFAAGGAVAAALVLGFSLALYGFVTASRERDAKELALLSEAKQRSLAEANRERAETEFERAQREADNARQQAAKAEAVSAFLQDMLGSANAENLSREEKAKGRNVTVMQVLAEAVKKLDSDSLKDEPLVEASVRHTIGSTYKALGDYPSAEPHLVRALEMRRAALGAQHPDVATSLHALASLRWRQGRFEEAEASHKEALGIRKAAFGDESAEVAESVQDLALVEMSLGRAAEAESLLRESLAMRRKLFGGEHIAIAQSLNNLALFLQTQSRLAEAESYSREAVEMDRKLLGELHPRVASGLNNLALVLKQQGKLKEAEPLYREVMAMDRKLLGDDHPDLANSLMNTATLLRDVGKLDEAEPMYREALTIARKSLPPTHPNTATCLSGYGSLLLDMNRADEAESLLRECLAIRESALPKGDWRIAHARSLLGASLAAQGKFGEAETFAVAGYDEMRTAAGVTPARRRQSLERVIRLYELWDAAEHSQALGLKLAEWRSRLEAESKVSP